MALSSERERATEELRSRVPAAKEALLSLAGDLGEHAPSLLPLLLAHPSLGERVLGSHLERGPRHVATLFHAITEHVDDQAELRRALRLLRHEELIRIGAREIHGHADVDATSREVADLAAASFEAAVQVCRRNLITELGGDALDAAGVPVDFVVLGMGKLGGRELNFGSDVDVCYFYATDEGSAADETLSVHDFFARLARRVTKAIGEVTDDGFVFRVDLRLRPEGSRGPMVNSVASAERYYESFGRPWERAALLRARPVAGALDLGAYLLESLRPFVFPRSVDPRIAEAMHAMVLRSRRDLGADPVRNVKLGVGGIREAEFFVQALQLVWGGRHPQLRVTGTVDAIRRLQSLGLLADGDAADLEAAWALLRRVEHRIHARKGYPTFDLPTGDEGDHLARSLGFIDGRALAAALAPCRAHVHRLFASLASNPSEEEAALGRSREQRRELVEAVAEGASAAELAKLLAQQLEVHDRDEASAHLWRAGRHPSSPFAPLGARAHPWLAYHLLDDVSAAADPDAALRGLSDLFGRGGVTFARWLAEEPRIRKRLVGMFGASPMLAQMLVRHPEGLGELLQASGPASDVELARAHAHLGRPGLADDDESFVQELRRLRRENILRIGLAFIASDVSAREASARLTALAEHQTRTALRRAIESARARYGQPSCAMAVIGMGKLGSKELGFGSDLDLLFVYQRDGETEGGQTYGDVFTRVAQRTMGYLSQLSGHGPGYAIDARLRPSGTHGVLTVSERALERYHRSDSEGWERLALVRARAIATTSPRFPNGHDGDYASHVDELLVRLAAGRGRPEPRRIAELRGRMQTELARENSHRYHPKLGYGGLVDVELATQFLLLGCMDGSRATRAPRHTLSALEWLEGLAPPDDACLRSASESLPRVESTRLAALRNGYQFFRAVEQAMQLLDPQAEGLVFGGPRSAAVTRRLGLRARDGVASDEVLRRDWERIANEVRDAFEAIVGPVDAPAPWAAAGPTAVMEDGLTNGVTEPSPTPTRAHLDEPQRVDGDSGEIADSPPPTPGHPS